jgi:hypothetical protein
VNRCFHVRKFPWKPKTLEISHPVTADTRSYPETLNDRKMAQSEADRFGSGGRTFDAYFVELRVRKVPAQMHPTPQL